MELYLRRQAGDLSVAECLDKINMLNSNSALRDEIAASGYKRMLKDHTIGRRIDDFSTFINKVV